MPTTLPRHQITETPAVAHALDVAARRWPDQSRSKLLLRLLDVGSNVVEQERNEEVARRADAVRASSGKYGELFNDNYLTELREDWPE